MTNILKNKEFVWHTFTRKEEYESKSRDEFDRFPSSASSLRDLRHPVVSEYIIEKGVRIEFPNNSKFAICLTHDVDFINSRMLAKIARELHLKPKLWDLIHKTRKTFGYSNSINDIIRLEESYNAHSTFFLLPLRQNEPDYNYSIEEISEEISELIRCDKEIGLHGGHNSYCNIEKLENDKKRIEEAIGKKVFGYRNHRLRFRTPLTWNILEQKGFKYDSTFGYVDAIGFRNGMCHPFRPYDLMQQRFIDIIEIPLVIMDTTLFHYMNLNENECWQVIRMTIDIIEKYQGAAAFLWHNHNIRGWKGRLYRKLLSYCKEKKAWLASGEEIAKWAIDSGFIESVGMYEDSRN